MLAIHTQDVFAGTGLCETSPESFDFVRLELIRWPIRRVLGWSPRWRCQRRERQDKGIPYQEKRLVPGSHILIVCQTYEITPENVALDMDRVTAAYERLDKLLENCRYLVGDRFSRADLTLAALAAPTWRPPEHSTNWPPDELYPHEIKAFWARFAKTRTREHVLRMYREHRLPKLDARGASAGTAGA